MHRTRPARHATCAIALVLVGCASVPETGPQGASTPSSAGRDPAPPAAGAPPDAPTSMFILGASDSVGSLPGSPDAKFLYRFKQTAPAGERFTFRDRDLSFSFLPRPSALYFSVENLQGRAVSIDWDRSKFFDPFGRSGDVANQSTRWQDRFGSQPPTQVGGLQRYSDYLFPIDYLLDPIGQTGQPHKPLLPEDSTAPTYLDKEFGVDLVFVIEDRPRTYAFRFRVASVIPR